MKSIMKFNKTHMALYGGITAGFFVLGILLVLFGGANIDKTDIAIIFSMASALLVSFAVLYQKQSERKGKSCDSEAVTYYVP